MQGTAETIDEAWRRLGRGDFHGAADLSGRLLKAAPDDASALSCHALSNWRLGAEIGPVLADMRRAAQLAPEVASVRHNLGMVLASNGELEAAADNFRHAIALKPDDTEAFHSLSQNFRFTEETPLVRQMLALYAAGTLAPRAREFLCFGLAKVYADLGRPERAMHFCVEANWITQRPYDPEPARADLAELRRLVAADAFRQTPAAVPGELRPVFIVGMPRSGTTLVESVLARHPAVFAGGEMPHMFDVEQALLNWARHNQGYAGGAHDLLGALPGEFFARNAVAVGNRVTAAARRPFEVFTDKLPDNSQRLGLIARLFPKARVIYLRRHALDCCISNYFQHFARGQGFSFRQDLLGERYRQVAETMALWRRGLDLPILEVSYEGLVASPEPTIRRIVAFAGLDWDEACLAPERAGNRVLTASQWQVKQPINASSVDRWRAYAEWVGPLIAALGGLDWVEAEQREVAAATAA